MTSRGCTEKIREQRRKDRRAERERAGGTYALNKRWRDRNPVKNRAHRAVYEAVRSGKLQKRPCEVCGTTIHVHAHHEDYSLPLEVMWLCALHHKLRHIELAALGLCPDAALKALERDREAA